MPGDTDYRFSIPAYVEDLSQQANVMLQVGAIAGRLALEERTQADHETGRAENVAEHAHMLSRIAPIMALTFYPDLNVGKVSLFATIHDDVEAYVGDTATHEPTAELFRLKAAKEKHGTKQLLAEYAHIPAYTDLIREYDAQVSPEARFVRVLDKIMPFITHFNQGGATLVNSWSLDELRHYSDIKHRGLAEEYPDFIELLELRQEIIGFAIRLFYDKSARPKQ